MGLFRQDGKPLDPKFANYLATADLSELHEQLLSDVPHPTDPSRSMQRDLTNRVSELYEKQVASGAKSNRFEHRDVRNIVRKLSEEYQGVPNLPAKPTEEQLEKVVADMEAGVESADAAMHEALEAFNAEYSDANIKRMVTEALAGEQRQFGEKHSKLTGSLAPGELEGDGVEEHQRFKSSGGEHDRSDEHGLSEEEGFEEESMFSPTGGEQGDSNTTKSQDGGKPQRQKQRKANKKANQQASGAPPQEEPVSEEAGYNVERNVEEFEPVPSNFGSNLRKR